MARGSTTKRTAKSTKVPGQRQTMPRVRAEVKPENRYRASMRVAHLTPDERVARGKAARTEVPRSSHAIFDPPAWRPDPVTLLEGQAVTRVPELVPIRYGRMLTSPFAFYRGAALVMASDLAGTATSGLHAQVCGDAHLSNFGLFASPERQLVFDLNDFDETLPGPWEWDVKRLTASLEIAGRGNGFSAGDRKDVVLAAVKEYRTAMRSFAEMRNLEVWHQQWDASAAGMDLAKDAENRLRKQVGKITAKAKTHDHLRAFNKLVTIVDGQPRFNSDPPLLVPVEELVDATISASEVEETVRNALRAYRSTLTTERRRLLEGYRYVQIARKVVGVGSVGTRAWVVLLIGRDNSDPLLLQVKEAQASVLEAFVGRSEYNNSGHRVVAGQRLMQATSDMFLGWQRIQGFDGQTRDFFIRQLHDWKGSVEIEQMSSTFMQVYARICGWTLARAHARSGDRIAIASYLGNRDTFDQALAKFSVLYADRNERDHAALDAAVAAGKVKAELDV